MPILYDMADKGWIDSGIVKDMDRALLPFDGKELPDPQPPDGAA